MEIKICGITTFEAARNAVDAGATMIGFVFAPSKRRVAQQQAKEIIDSLPASIEKVGVFVNAPVEHICEVAADVGLTMIQLHGEEPASMIKQLPYPVMKAFSIDQFITVDLQAYDPAYFLIDSPPAQFKGGTGIPFDWERLRTSADLGRPFLIAGGLTPRNVEEAIQTSNCYGVDVSSGVETNGEKDHEKITLFIQRAKGEF